MNDHTVGRPVKNIQIRIFDNASGQECAVGQFVVCESFPTLPNGKVDGVKLKADLIEKCKK